MGEHLQGCPVHPSAFLPGMHSSQKCIPPPSLSGEILFRHNQRPEERVGLLLPDCLEVCLQSDFSLSCCAAAAKSLQSCPTLCDPIDGSPLRRLRLWDSPGKNTGVGCHFLLQCMKVKSESEVTQLCPTLSDPMDCSPPGSSIHGIFQARVLEWGAIAFSDR